MTKSKLIILQKLLRELLLDLFKRRTARKIAFYDYKIKYRIAEMCLDLVGELKNENKN